MEVQEKQLIKKVLKGDTSAFSYFVSTYQDMAFTIAYRICKNRQDAEDIVQESFVRAFRNLQSFRSSSKFSTWLYRIVYNTAINAIQSSIYRTEFTEYEQTKGKDLYSDLNPAESIEEHEKKIAINKILDKMPNDEALILSLFYLEENSIKDVSHILSLTESNVKVRLHRARKRFAEMTETLHLTSTLN